MTYYDHPQHASAAAIEILGFAADHGWRFGHSDSLGNFSGAFICGADCASKHEHLGAELSLRGVLGDDPNYVSVTISTIFDHFWMPDLRWIWLFPPLRPAILRQRRRPRYLHWLSQPIRARTGCRSLGQDMARWNQKRDWNGLDIFPTLRKLKNHRHRPQEVFTPLSEGATLNGLELGVFGVLLDFFTWTWWDLWPIVAPSRLRKGNFDDCKIFVGGLNLNTSVDQLMSSFAAYGQITDAAPWPPWFDVP